jgi:hypothetical protein
MLRSITVLVMALIVTGVSGAADFAPPSPVAQAHILDTLVVEPSARTPEFLQMLGVEQPAAAVTQQRCCKICRQGKACGDTCISRDKVCHVGPGCACDG